MKNKKENLEIRFLEEQDLPSLSTLYRAVFHVDKSERYWKWKFFQNPAGPHMLAAAIECESGRVVGTVGAIPIMIGINGRKVHGCQTCDIVIMPEYQKGGPFMKLHKLATSAIQQNSQLMYGFSIKKTLKISTRLLKFKNVMPIARQVRVLHPKHLILQKLPVPPLASLLGATSLPLLKAYFSIPFSLPEGCKVTENPDFDQRYDSFAASLADNFRLMVYKDSTYLNWRYKQCPDANYMIFAIENHEQVFGFTVIALVKENDGEQRAYIMELLARPGSHDITDCLLKKAVEFCYVNKVATMTIWPPENTKLRILLKKRGFFQKDTGHNLVIREHFDEVFDVETTEPENWHISLGDSDYH